MSVNMVLIFYKHIENMSVNIVQTCCKLVCINDVSISMSVNMSSNRRGIVEESQVELGFLEGDREEGRPGISGLLRWLRT